MRKICLSTLQKKLKKVKSEKCDIAYYSSNLIMVVKNYSTVSAPTWDHVVRDSFACAGGIKPNPLN